MNIPASLDAIADRILEVYAATLGGPVVDVSTDPTTLRLPGILVRFTSLEVETLDGGHAVQAQVLVVAPDRTDPRALEMLSERLPYVLDADLEVTGPVTALGVILPTQPHPMPGLSVPVQIHESE